MTTRSPYPDTPMEARTTFQNIDPEKQRRVLEEAGREFADHGFNGASMNRLSATLSIAKGSIFKYFGNKEGLFSAVFAGSVERFAGFLRTARDETRGRPLAERLERLFLVGARFVEDHPVVYRIHLKMLFNDDFPLRRRYLGQVRALSTKFLTPFVEEAKASEELPKTLDTALAVFLLDAALDRFIQARAAGGAQGVGVPGDDDPRALAGAASGLARMLAAGLAQGGIHA